MIVLVNFAVTFQLYIRGSCFALQNIRWYFYTFETLIRNFLWGKGYTGYIFLDKQPPSSLIQDSPNFDPYVGTKMPHQTRLNFFNWRNFGNFQFFLVFRILYMQVSTNIWQVYVQSRIIHGLWEIGFWPQF